LTVTPVNDAPRNLTASSTVQSVQYSDPTTDVTLTAMDIDSAASSLAATTSWKKSTDASFVTTQPLGGLTLTPTGSTSSYPRAWTLAGRALVGEGVYTVRICISDGAATSTIDVTITVTKEDAAIEFTGDTLVATTSGGSNPTANVPMTLLVRESTDGSLGNQLTGKTVNVAGYNGNNLSTTPSWTCTVTLGTEVNGVATTSSSSGCPTALTADNYTLKLSLATNPYYTAPVEVVALTVAVPGTGFTTGGGWIANSDGSRNNFGFTVKYLKNGNIQGNSLYIYRKTVGPNEVANPAGGYLAAGQYDWIAKSNAMSLLTQTCGSATPKVCWASFTGKSNITAVDRTTGALYSLGGNRSFQVDVTDNSEPGSSPGAGPDTYGIKVWDGNGLYYQLAPPSAQGAITQLKINGGNIQVRP
jgi:hypothetical protein